MSCTVIFFLKCGICIMQKPLAWGNWALWFAPPDFIICILQASQKSEPASKYKAREKMREEERKEVFSVWLPARIKCEPSLSTPWVIMQVAVDLHLSTFCCRGHWLHSHKSDKVQYLTLSTPLPCLFCNSNQSLEVSIELVYCSRCCQSKWVIDKIKDVWSQEAAIPACCF